MTHFSGFILKNVGPEEFTNDARSDGSPMLLDEDLSAV